MDYSSFLLADYKINLHKNENGLAIEAEACLFQKFYKHYATNETIQSLDHPFINNIDDLHDILNEGLSMSNPNTKVFLKDGPVLELETTTKFGKSEKINKVCFELKDQHFGDMAICERRVIDIEKECSKADNSKEVLISKIPDIFQILQKVVPFCKDVEENVKPRICDLENIVSLLGDRVSELQKKVNPKIEDSKDRFDGINKELERHNMLLTNASRRISSNTEDNTKTQTKVAEICVKIASIEKVVKELEGKLA